MPRWPALLLLLIHGPAAPAVAEERAQVAAGRTLFEAHCRICHGPAADAGEAGDITGVTRSIVARATRGIEKMPKLELSPAEIDALVAYLGFLWEQ